MPTYRTFQYLEEYIVSSLQYRVYSINLEKAEPGRELWHGGDSRLHDDEVAEWLRRWTANPMCSARVGSNPILVELFLLYCKIQRITYFSVLKKIWYLSYLRRI